MAENRDNRRNRTVKRFTYRGKEMPELSGMKDENLYALFTARARRKLTRSQGIKGRYLKLVERVKRSKLNLQPGERPKMIKTHLRNGIIMPEMVGGNVAVYNGKEYKEVEVKFDMIGRYLGEFSLTYKPTLRKAAVSEKGKRKGDDRRK